MTDLPDYQSILMGKYLLNIFVLTITAVGATPWMPWDVNPSAYSKTNHQINTTSSVNANAQHTNAFSKQLFNQVGGYTKTQLDSYYEGLANYYHTVKRESNYHGYRIKGYADYMPKMDNNTISKK